MICVTVFVFPFKVNLEEQCLTSPAWVLFSFLSFGEMLAFTLTAFLELMDHGIVSWDLISLSFIKQVPPPEKNNF